MKQFDLKYISIMIVIASLVFISKFMSQHILTGVLSVLEFEYSLFILGSIAVVVELAHNLKFKTDLALTQNMSFNQFKNKFEYVFSIIANPLTIVSSFALAKGLVFSYTDKYDYFPYFNNIELSFIGIVTMYLMVVSILELWSNFVEVVRKEKTVIITPVEKPKEKKLPISE